MSDMKAYIDELIRKARVAQKEFEAKFTTQLAVDTAVRAIGKVVYDNREILAKMAHEETGYGTVEQKMGKIVASMCGQWNNIRGHKSMGYIDNFRDEPGVKVIAKPIGVVGSVCPATNPIITVCGNAMMAVKCRNAIIAASHPSAKNSTDFEVKMIQDALEEIGAPRDLVQCIDAEHSSLEATSTLISSTDTNIATGGPGMVKAVYSCGKPGFGVGQGNTQEIYAPDWDDWDTMAVSSIANRKFDFGVPCVCEQMLHIPAEKEADFLAAWQKNGAYLVEDPDQIDALRKVIFPGGRLNRDVVGKSPAVVAKMAGIDIPEDAPILLAKVQGVAEEDVLCKEILFPFERYRTYTDFKETVDVALKNLEMEGAGHNSAIMSHDQELIDYVSMKLPVCRLHVNQNTSGQNNGIPSTMTLGCGFWSGNSLSENFEWYHLYQVTKVTTTLPNKRTWQEGDWDRMDVCPVVE